MANKDDIMAQLSITNSLAKVMKMYGDHSKDRRVAVQLYDILMKKVSEKVRENTARTLYSKLLAMEIGIAGVGKAEIIEFNQKLGRFILVLQKKVQYTEEFMYNVEYINFLRIRLLKDYLTCFAVVENDYTFQMNQAFFQTYEFINDSIKIYNRLHPEEMEALFKEFNEKIDEKSKKESMEAI